MAWSSFFFYRGPKKIEKQRNVSDMFWLVVSTPLKNMSSSVGTIIPNIWKNKKNVPNHQPVFFDEIYFTIFRVSNLLVPQPP